MERVCRHVVQFKGTVLHNLFGQQSQQDTQKKKTQIKMGLFKKISAFFSSSQRTPELVRVCDCEKSLNVNKKLIKAAKLHHVDCLKRCLEEGADVNAKKTGWTALDYLAETKEKHYKDGWRYWNWDFGYL